MPNHKLNTSTDYNQFPKGFLSTNVRSNIKETENEDYESVMSMINSNKSIFTQNSFGTYDKSKRKLSTNKEFGQYGKISSNCVIQRNYINKTASRYIDSQLKYQHFSDEKVKERREVTMIKDRLHILDRISNSLNGSDANSVSDFSDARSIKYKKNKKVLNPYQIESKQLRNNQIVLNLKERLNKHISRNASQRYQQKTNNSIHVPNIREYRKGSKEDENDDDFGQYQNFQTFDVGDFECVNKYHSREMIQRLNKEKPLKRESNSYGIVDKQFHSVSSPINQQKPEVQENKINLKELKKKKVFKDIIKINNKLDPQFKLAKIDIEELQASQALQLGEWNREPSPDMIMNMKKEERRKEYWKRRIKH